jgi:hypothetical protein
MPRIKVNDYPQMKIRLSPELKAMIDKAAKANNRTLNAEITTRLEETFSGTGDYPSEEKLRQIIREELKAQK